MVPRAFFGVCVGGGMIREGVERLHVSGDRTVWDLLDWSPVVEHAVIRKMERLTGGASAIE